MFKKKPEKIPYDKTNKKAVLKCSICTGEQVAGFKDIHTGHFDEIMLIRDAADLDTFMEMYDLTAIVKEY
ncbi:MAG: aspartate dehydrogenase [Lachnospiraceae bacterium]